ncbi:sigma-70 family RNA polymerase sigma factor [Lapidilactobacillus bayanensis]|uniref:sigma-70 family RNA polymerase sigma factor n=1 Tax=Lapidilactobacillus bayanensis TaxID=2485998 RepID=UPI000F7666D9|nr:sigma-70 family RNA polymerase sigma factor [Lapidilactobacillus bayanensis]
MNNTRMDSQQRNLTTGLQAALQQPRLIRGAVKRAGIWRGSQDYDDFLQEAYLAFAQAYVNYDGDPETDDRFKAYAFRQIVWHVIDLLRRDRYRQGDILPDFDVIGDLATYDSEVEILLLLQQLAFAGNELDQLIIRDHFLKGYPLAMIAYQQQVTPRALRQHRASLRGQLAEILYDQL